MISDVSSQATTISGVHLLINVTRSPYKCSLVKIVLDLEYFSVHFREKLIYCLPAEQVGHQQDGLVKQLFIKNIYSRSGLFARLFVSALWSQAINYPHY